MAQFDLKMTLASSIAFRANNKASREIHSEGNDLSDYNNPVYAEGTNFDKYLNTYLALVDYKLNHASHTSVMDKVMIDPTEYQLLPKYADIINASVVMFNKTSSVFQKPVFSYKLGDLQECMSPAYFNAYQQHFSNIGDSHLFEGTQSFEPKIVTLMDLKDVVGSNNEMLVVNADGTVAPEVSYALGISLPITGFSDYTTRDRDLSEEDVLLWLNN